MIEIGPVSFIDLEAERTVWVPELSIGVIPHGTEVEMNASIAFIISAPRTMVDKCLLVCPQVFEGGPLFTTVFNLSNQTVRVKAGEIISKLVAL